MSYNNNCCSRIFGTVYLFLLSFFFDTDQTRISDLDGQRSGEGERNWTISELVLISIDVCTK